jgi:hypothetical protein
MASLFRGAGTTSRNADRLRSVPTGRRGDRTDRPVEPVMIAITITPAAFKALKVIRPSTRDTPVSLDGMVRIWLDPLFVGELGRMRDAGETYSDVILRLAESG